MRAARAKRLGLTTSTDSSVYLLTYLPASVQPNSDPTALLFLLQLQRGRDAGGARQKVRLRAIAAVCLPTYGLTRYS